MTSDTTIEAGAVLTAARRLRAEAEAAEVGVLLQAVEWCRLHETADPNDAAIWGSTLVPLAGGGVPWIAEFCIPEFAAALGVSTDSGRSLLAHAVELAHRLPRIFERVVSGALLVWRARRVAEQTICLTPDGADYVDTQLAPFAHKSGPVVTERLVDEAIHGCLDIADALELEAAVQAGAAALKVAGSEDSLDVRRAAAWGVMARGDGALGLEGARRDLTLYVHLVSTGSTNASGHDVARVENAGTQLVTRAQVAAWCRIPEARISVRPVIDLNASLSSPGYAPSDRLREQIVLRDRTCVSPWRNRSARRTDLDHVVPWDSGGATDSSNLAALCRRHHRLTTHGGWNCTVLEPGSYLWRSPHGYSYLRDTTGTQDLTPRPVEPPGRDA